jgi:hypothetical protein
MCGVVPRRNRVLADIPAACKPYSGIFLIGLVYLWNSGLESTQRMILGWS